MISLCNLHTHTTYCDGKNTPEEMICEAIRLGLHTIGFSGHAPADLLGGEAWCMSDEAAELYRKDLQALKGKYAEQIEVAIGLELDYYSPKPDWVEYTIGSVHQLKHPQMEFPVDLDYAQIVEAVKVCYDGDFLAYAKDFYALSADVAKKTKCDIVGHFDLLTKFNEKYHYLDESDSKYQAIALEALDAVMESDVLFEINTGAISRGWRTAPYPAPFILKHIAAQRGRVILNSDAHAKESLLCEFENTCEYAKACGVSELWVYRNGSFVPTKVQ